MEVSKGAGVGVGGGGAGAERAEEEVSGPQS